MDTRRKPNPCRNDTAARVKRKTDGLVFIERRHSVFLSSLDFFTKKVNLLIIGLDNAGKSTLLSIITDGRLIQHRPTLSVWSKELTIGNLTFQAFDLGGQREVRRVWRDYFPAVDGIVYMVDASDKERLQEAGREINGVLTDELVANVPVLILGNKIDKQHSVARDELIHSLGVHIHLSENINTDDKSTVRPCKLIMCSLLKMVGYGEGFRWMAEQLK